MSNTYPKGSTFLKYLNVLRADGSVPVYPDEYAAPTYQIVFKNGVFSTIVADTAMTQGAGNVWYFSYTVPTNALDGTYLIKYKATVNLVAVESTEDYIVGHALTAGTGEFEIVDVVQTDAMAPIEDADVWVFTDVNLSNAIAHDTTDVLGEFTVLLDEGEYWVLFVKTGFINETHKLTVDSMGGHVFEGD
jgi:hypothetical protein